MAADHYSILGVPRDATTQDIKRAFRRIARECHPDIAGDDPDKVARFQEARIAYEILMDPVTRARYDRRGERRSAPTGGGTFFDAFYRRTGELQKERADKAKQRGERSGRRVRNAGGTSGLGLDDLLDGFGGGRSKPPPQTNTPDMRRAIDPVPGRDLEIELEIPEAIARKGGAVTATYSRMRRVDRWTPGDVDPGLQKVEDICEVRILPGTPEGVVLRQMSMGDAGPWGGAAGDLLVRIKVAPPEDEIAEPADEPQSDVRRVNVSLGQAVLGGKVLVETPRGPVMVTIPEGTSSHTRMRLRGKGAMGPGGQPEDLWVEVRIVVPKMVDDESAALIEAFGKLRT